MDDLSKRSTGEVLDDHLRLRTAGVVESDIARNFAPDVVVMTPKAMKIGHEAVRQFNRMLREHVPHEYLFPARLTKGGSPSSNGGRASWAQRRGRRGQFRD